jgi:hypothetical protein
MDLWAVILIVVAVILVINLIGSAFDNKTGWVVGSLVAGAITSYLLTGMRQAADDSVNRPPGQVYCQQIGKC